MASEVFEAQAALLVRVLPYVATETCFALKGGPAINLFVRDLPRLSVDIDLVYLPIEDRETSLIREYNLRWVVLRREFAKRSRTASLPTALKLVEHSPLFVRESLKLRLRSLPYFGALFILRSYGQSVTS